MHRRLIFVSPIAVLVGLGGIAGTSAVILSAFIAVPIRYRFGVEVTARL